MKKHSFVTVSNRLPITVSKKNGELEFNVSNGGLSTAMSSLNLKDAAWVGWCGTSNENLTAKDKHRIKAEFSRYNSVPVFLTEAQVAHYYEGYANTSIWPLFHYFQTHSHNRNTWWKSYVEVNELFAATVLQVASAHATVWVHDYHMMLVPGLLRERASKLNIGFFLHIPFPSFEIFRLLPERERILEGILGSDLIGFHINDYAQHFIDSCARLLGVNSDHEILFHGNRRVKASVYPIGIDYEKFQKTVVSREAKKEIKKLDKSYKGQKLILSMDRLDYTKGIVERLEGFDKLLNSHPEYLGKIRLLMIAVPSRTGVDSYVQLRDDIERAVGRINGRYGTVDWAPISYQFQNRPFTEIVALYARADVALVTPIRDGMNLVAKEFVAAKQSSAGVLVLSEMTGAIDELPEAISVNPNNTESIALALHDALSMSTKEQRRRLGIMRERLRVSDVKDWSERFVRDIETAANPGVGLGSITSAEHKDILKKFSRAKSRLLILDYDGTLKKFVNTPSAFASAPTPRLRKLLRNLSNMPNTTVAIATGRTRSTLIGWFVGIPKLVLAAEHGAWIRHNKKWHKADGDFETYREDLKTIMKSYVARTEGSEFEEKDFGLVWHYINVEPQLAYRRTADLSRELENAIDSEHVGMYRGHNIIEVKQKNVNKGHAVEAVLDEKLYDFVLCAGDDYTDEDMFSVVNEEAITIKVGPGATKAKFQVESVDDMVDLLGDISEHKK